MNVFVIPLWVMIIVAFLAWGVVIYLYWFKPNIKPKLDDYFAQRRHDRRLRNYANGRVLYDVNTIRKPEVYRATARHRR